MTTNVLELANVSKAYRTRQGPVAALSGVSFGVAAGEFVALRGPSGSGKTTALLAAAGLLTVDSGDVTVAGTRVNGLSAEGRARLRASTMGFAFQQFHLIPYLTVLENVLVPGLSPGAPEGGGRRAQELVAQFGLVDRTHHTPGQLSAGEQQRVALARALVNQPKVILADEPTGNLDEENALMVLRHLEEFARAGGAVLLVTHDPTAAAHARRCVRLEAGRVVPA